MVPSSSSPTAELVQKTLTAHDYALELQRDQIAQLIRQRAALPSYDQRFFRVLQANDVRRCDTFIRCLRNEKREHNLAIQGFFFAAQLGSVRLLDYFLTRWKVDVNVQQRQSHGFFTTGLLTAITHQQNEAAKFLLFRHADPSIKGEFDNALVTALHWHSNTDLLRLLLDKNVDLTARHPDYRKLTLREYCVFTDRVKAKKELDLYIVRLINHGNYDRLKWLVDRGYTHINVSTTSKRNGRQLAKERYFEKIVRLIDDVERAQVRARMKMNY